MSLSRSKPPQLDQPSSKVVDLGANYHVTPDLASLHISNEYNGKDQLRVGNGQSLQI